MKLMLLLQNYIIVDCDFAIVDIEGKTALHWTASNPDPSCIKAIVDCFPSLLNVKLVNIIIVYEEAHTLCKHD